MIELVLDFMNDETPVLLTDVIEITGMSADEVRSSYQIIKIEK